eukprot:TRINITY_DN1915_c0_g1_i1.p1 TRINITY_DN1915_c0_g1~~TRINITY_DN1915_c0_g1_i1.p1  ORF type:complete len:137 (+),score=2.90 TRINITY_DN1915_c0_g1_i1:57-413(+)
MCIEGCCEVSQTKNFTGCDCFSVNAFLASLFICSPFSKGKCCHDCCGSLFWIISLFFRVPIGFFFFMAGLFFDAIIFFCWIISFAWCCGKCHKWGCKYCCKTKKRMATDCLIIATCEL